MNNVLKKRLKQELKIMDTIIKQTKLYKKEVDREISKAYDDTIINNVNKNKCIRKNFIEEGTNYIYGSNRCKENFLKQLINCNNFNDIFEEVMKDEIRLKSLRHTVSDLSKSLKELKKRRNELWNQIFLNKQ